MGAAVTDKWRPPALNVIHNPSQLDCPDAPSLWYTRRRRYVEVRHAEASVSQDPSADDEASPRPTHPAPAPFVGGAGFLGAMAHGPEKPCASRTSPSTLAKNSQGGAFGSMAAQFLHLTSTERKTLLVAGAAGGMSATFASPVAATLLAAELLLFEWKPRSLVPVALASTTAAVIRRYLLGFGPLFPVPAHNPVVSPDGLLFCAIAGLLSGVLSVLLTNFVYWSEDAFFKLPIHWMWWPAIGGFLIGLGGLLFPQALGVGYETIGALLQGDAPIRLIIGILCVKSAIWALALGSGTSGGVLAPLLMMGAALGGIESMIFPAEGLGFWPLISMAAILGGTMRVPFTAVIFVLELTHDYSAILPLFIAVIVAYAFTVLTMKRSILTEKISRRGIISRPREN